MVTDKQVLKKLTIDTLRGIKNLEISFEGNPVTESLDLMVVEKRLYCKRLYVCIEPKTLKIPR